VTGASRLATHLRSKTSTAPSVRDLSYLRSRRYPRREQDVVAFEGPFHDVADPCSQERFQSRVPTRHPHARKLDSSRPGARHDRSAVLRDAKRVASFKHVGILAIRGLEVQSQRSGWKARVSLPQPGGPVVGPFVEGL